MPVLRCDKNGCGFSTDNEPAMMRHVLREELETFKPPEQEKPKPRHRTTDEARGFLACPECRKSFVEAAKEDPKFLEEITPKPKPEEKKPEQKRGLKLFERRKEG